MSRIGPPLSVAPADPWRNGAGKLRVVCHEASSITSMTLRGESLCFGTSTGRIRVVDLQSGAKVGVSTVFDLQIDYIDHRVQSRG